MALLVETTRRSSYAVAVVCFAIQSTDLGVSHGSMDSGAGKRGEAEQIALEKGLVTFQSPFRSGIEIEDYQLDPLVWAIQMTRANLLIADDVGLGKTIEAGMVALELIIRHRARKILVVCPSALQIQWRDQRRDKFGLDFRIVDSNLMRELRRRRGIHVNPWSHFPRLITSIDFLKRERPRRLFRETLPAQGEPAYPRKYDLLIVDEAHNCAPSGAGKYATDSLRTQALRELAPHFEHKLFLTATPHNGYRESFSALLELLDNQRFSRGTEPDHKQLEVVMIRRLKSDPSFAFNHLGIRRFPPRILEPIEVPYTDEEREMVALKIETIREDLGKVGTVIAEQVEEAMLGRRSALNTENAEKEAEPIRKMLRFERDLQKQVQALMEQYRETRKELRLSPDNIRQVVAVGLSLAGQPALIPTKTESGQTCFQLPPLKGSWAACAEGLEHPHTKDIRPITFDESVSRGRDDVVLAHLNHRLPQMCLRLLRAEVWAEKGRSKLQRVTARVVPNDVLDTPALIAHARLVVIGGDSHRLHEEIIAAGGFIKDQKWGGRLNVGQVESALTGATTKEPSSVVKAKLLELYPSLISSLASALEARMKQMVEGLQKKLAERAYKETNDIEFILTELKKSIEAVLKEPAYIQPMLFDDPDRDRFERNKDAMRTRAKEIPEEIARETSAIRARFADPQARMFPVAVTFLVPESIAGTH